jgi:uncharacterized protein (DUF433 family)
MMTSRDGLKLAPLGGNWSMPELNPRITVEAGKMGGKPGIRGLRFTVYDLASYLASGMSEEQILLEFPYLEKEDFQAVYGFFASIPERIAVPEGLLILRSPKSDQPKRGC